MLGRTSNSGQPVQYKYAGTRPEFNQIQNQALKLKQYEQNNSRLAIMNLSITLTLVAALFLAVLACPSEAGPTGHNPKSPEFVVKYGNKSFYKYELELVSWMAARDLCKFFGLQLAEFSDHTEWNFLRTAFREVQHWIGASVKGVNGPPNEAFEWASGNGTVALDLPLVPAFDHFICVYADGSDHFYTDSCLNGRHKVLCQDFA